MMLVLMAVAIAALDLVTSSEVHSFLFGRLDQQISASQDEIVGYIDHVYDAEVRRGDNSAQTNPTAWLDGLEAKPQVSHPHLPRFRRLSRALSRLPIFRTTSLPKSSSR